MLDVYNWVERPSQVHHRLQHVCRSPRALDNSPQLQTLKNQTIFQRSFNYQCDNGTMDETPYTFLCYVKGVKLSLNMDIVILYIQGAIFWKQRIHYIEKCLLSKEEHNVKGKPKNKSCFMNWVMRWKCVSDSEAIQTNWTHPHTYYHYLVTYIVTLSPNLWIYMRP